MSPNVPSRTLPVPEHTDFTVATALRSPRLLKTEVLAGLVVALALIPEAIAFSIIAGVDPRVGLYASFIMAVTTALVGGRTGLISAATGAVALVIAPVVPEHGFDFLIATIILAGLMQIAMSAIGVAKLMRFIPRSVMVGFVNALAILIVASQIENLVDVPWLVYPITAVSLLLLVIVPRLTQAVPGPLVTVALITLVVVLFALDVPNVGDKGSLPTSLPSLFFPSVPWSLDTLRIIAPYAFGVAMVGLLESLMTAKLVDDITDSHSNKTRVGFGQGIANVTTGFFGGLGGCAVVAQTMINVKESGARTRLSTFLSGVFLMVLVVGLGGIVEQIPMAALVAVMIMASVATFDWHSIRLSTLRQLPASATTIMVVTVAVTVLTNNLAYGVIIGVIVAMIFFARRVAHFTEVVDIAHPDDDTRVYAVRGALFFASSNDLIYQFDYVGDPEHVIIDLSQAQIYDSSTVGTLDAIVSKYANKGKTVEIIGINDPSARWHALSGKLGADN